MNIAIIIACGSGNRIGQDIPKQFIMTTSHPSYTKRRSKMYFDSVVANPTAKGLLTNSNKQPVGLKLTSMSGGQTFNEVIITDPTGENRAYA